MIYTETQLLSLEGQAVDAAKAAGAVIRSYQDKSFRVDHKASGDSLAQQVVTEVDHKAQGVIVDMLRPSLAAYDLALLAEESTDNRERLKKSAFWSIDPIDGTLAFVKGIAGYSVSIGLVSREGEPLVGVVYDPVTGDLYRAVRGRGATKNALAMSLPERDTQRPLLLRTDLSFQQHPLLEQTRPGLESVATRLGLSGVEIEYRVGGVMNACTVLQTANACFFKYPRSTEGGGSLWDYAATACIYREAGGVASDIYGQPMELNRTDSTFMNHKGLLFANDRSIADGVMAMYRGFAQD